jgi:hypothetical protein
VVFTTVGLFDFRTKPSFYWLPTKSHFSCHANPPKTARFGDFRQNNINRTDIIVRWWAKRQKNKYYIIICIHLKVLANFLFEITPLGTNTDHLKCGSKVKSSYRLSKKQDLRTNFVPENQKSAFPLNSTQDPMKPGLFFLTAILAFCGACVQEDDFLVDYDSKTLFAAPSERELEVIKADWQSRQLTPTDYEEEEAVELSDGKTLLKIISYRIDGLREYAALILPKAGDNLPVRVYVGGFGLGITENSVAIAAVPASDFQGVLAIPALRGQSLRVTLDGKTYVTPVSDGVHCDAFDGAADDVIGLLNLLENSEDRVNINRTAVRGGSRGATVSLLVAERDKRVKMAFAVAGPVDLLNLTAKHKNDPTYQCQFLNELVNGTSTIAETRRKIIASSPFYFADELPQTQMHLAENDRIVPVSEGQLLKEEMQRLGKQDSFELFIYEKRDHSNVASGNTLLNERIDSLLSKL